MYIGRNLSSPLQMQIEKIIINNAETVKLASRVDKDNSKQQHYKQPQQNADSGEQELEESKAPEASGKLDLIA